MGTIAMAVPSVGPAEDYSSVGSMIALVGLMLLVILGAYYATKFIAGRARGMTPSNHLHVLDRMVVGPGKTILLLSAGEKVFLVGVTNQTITMLGAMEKGDIKPLTEQQGASVISGSKGFSSAGDFISRLIHAPAALREARARGRQPDGDELEKMLNSLEKRNRRMSGEGEDREP